MILDTSFLPASQSSSYGASPDRPHGLVIVNTGCGKGKTTAALGMMTRAWGHRMRIGVIQFFKEQGADAGAALAAQRMGVDWLTSGDGFTWQSADLTQIRACALRGWELARQKIVAGEYDILILDEFTYVLHYAWVDIGEAIAWLQAHKPEDLHLIFTGCFAPQKLIEYADLVTEMRMVKHPLHEQGIQAQPGIEF